MQNDNETAGNLARKIQKKHEVFIRRAPKGRQNPFTMMPNAMLHDKEICPKSKGVFSFLLTLPDDWKVNPAHIASCLGVGIDYIYSVLKALIAAGYCRHVIIKDEKNRIICKYYEFSEDKEFKKAIAIPILPGLESEGVEKPDVETSVVDKNNNLLDFPGEDLGKPDLELPCKARTCHTNTIYTKEKETNTSPVGSVQSDEDIGRTLSFFLFEKLKTIHPDLRTPNFANWAKDMNGLVKIDKISTEKIKAVIEWLITDKFWSCNVMCPEKLRKHYDVLFANSNKNKSFSLNKTQNGPDNVCYVALDPDELYKRKQTAKDKISKDWYNFEIGKIPEALNDFISFGQEKLKFSEPRFYELLNHYLTKSLKAKYNEN